MLELSGLLLIFRVVPEGRVRRKIRGELLRSTRSSLHFLRPFLFSYCSNNNVLLYVFLRYFLNLGKDSNNP